VVDFREQVVLSQGALNDVAGFLAGHECLQKSLSVLRGDDLGHGAEDRAQLIGRAGGEPLLDGLEEPPERNITLAPKKLIRTRRASEGSASEPSLARRV